jgi:hypothetical protein
MRERLLEADPQELRGEGQTELARHLSRCAGCMALAQTILDGHRALDRGLSAICRDRAVEPLMERIRASERRSHPRFSWRWAVPATAAAVLVGLLLVRPSQFEPGSRDPWVPTQSVSWSKEGFIEAPSGQTMLVFETEDRSAKVIWFYGSEE